MQSIYFNQQAKIQLQFIETLALSVKQLTISDTCLYQQTAMIFLYYTEAIASKNIRHTKINDGIFFRIFYCEHYSKKVSTIMLSK